MTARTRIKICGLSRPEDIDAAVAAGADAIGLVFYEPSPRHVSAERAADLLRGVPPFVTSVGLFVNATAAQVERIVELAPVSLLQFHGDETPEEAAEIAKRVRRPFLRALRVRAGMSGADLLEYEDCCRATSPLFAGLLLDAYVDGYGGGGKVFDWSLIPKELAPRVVLSGGLSVQNAADAVRVKRPYAVDVSSGVESAKGVKDASRIRAFVGAVRQADAMQEK